MSLFNDVSKPPPPLPTADLCELRPGVCLLPPLTRRGHGPAVILLVPDNAGDRLKIADGVPSLLTKWAEEGYATIEVQRRAVEADPVEAFSLALAAIEQCRQCEPKDKIGLVGKSLVFPSRVMIQLLTPETAYDPDAWNLAAKAASSVSEISAVAIYANVDQEPSLAPATVPSIRHLAGKGQGRPVRTDSLTVYRYPGMAGHGFAVPFQEAFHYTTEALSHTRNLTLLKGRMGGPYFDLEHIWEEHTYYEFADRSVEHTMSTMVQEPYVNHVPVLTGGVGRENLTSFYRSHFIFSNSSDADLELVSRSIAIDRIIDEFVFTCTHNVEIDWMIPGIPPTGRRLEIPFTGVVNVRGDRLYHEHIWWDQGTVLRQLGLMPEYLPYPYPLPDGTVPAAGKRFEYRVPVAGVETANKLRDRNSGTSNQMFEFKVREV